MTYQPPDRTRRLLLSLIASGCGHESIRAMGRQVRRTESSVHSALRQLEAAGKITRCECGRGWIARPMQAAVDAEGRVGLE